jgi:hypothetical protein
VRGQRYLVCLNRQCPSPRKRWPYRDFDKSFHSAIVEIDRDELIESQQLEDKEAIELELTLWQEKKAAKQKEIDALYLQIVEDEREINELRAEIKELEMGLTEVPHPRKRSHGRTSERNDSVRLDARHATRIRNVVHDVLIARVGTSPRLAERIERAKRGVKIDPPTMEQAFIRGIKDLKDAPFFIVRFKNGEELLGVPDKKDSRLVDWWTTDVARGTVSNEAVKHGLPPARVVSVFSEDAVPDEFSIQLVGEGGKTGFPLSTDDPGNAV